MHIPIAGPADDTGPVDPLAWARQTSWWSVQQRNRGLIWPAGENWFVNDPLGPMPHTHPGASEVFFVAAGTLELTVGRTPLRLEAGDYCLVPPDTFHSPKNIGEDDMLVFVLVAPNRSELPWKASGFVPTDYDGTAEVIRTNLSQALPSDANITSFVSVLAPGEKTEGVESEADHTVYVLDGTLAVSVAHLSGVLNEHELTNVMVGSPYSLQNPSDRSARMLSLRARYHRPLCDDE